MKRTILIFAAAFSLLFLFGSWCKPMKNVPKALPSKKPPIAVPAAPCLPLVIPSPVKSDEKPPFKKKIVVIDAGHGGDDFGTESISKPRYKEKHLNLSTAKMLERLLQEMGFKTVMTRSNDTFVTLEKRAEIANKLQAEVFVSVHYNSAPSRQAEGIEVFFYRDDKDKDRVAASKKLAQLVLNKVIENTEAKSRGVKHGDLSVIRNTKMPAILIEGGFLTNDAEMQKLKDPAYLKSIALGIAQGVQAYLNKK